MNDQVPSLRPQDVVSVGTRIRWGTIVAGAVLAFAIYALLTVLGSAVGLSISDRVQPSTLSTGALVWALLTICAALFVGGLVTSLFTVGENKMEAVLYGVIMWGLVVGALLVMGTAGLLGGLNVMVGAANAATTAAPSAWENAAREAGATPKQIESWRHEIATNERPALTPEEKAAVKETATRLTWYAFAGMWISMFAAAGGAIVGAGPTFRIRLVSVPTSRPIQNDRRVVGSGAG